MRRTSLVTFLLLLASPAYAQWTNLPDINTTVCNASNDQYAPSVIPDGSGGVIIGWQDYRSGNVDIYAQRLDYRGNALWTANGLAVCTNASFQANPVLCSDGAGGVIMAWRDDRNANMDIYAQRLNSSGVAQWTANGVPVVVNAGGQDAPQILANGAGGGYVLWHDNRNANDDIYAQQLSSVGGQLWPAAGIAICSAAGAQYPGVIAPDGAGGFVAAWSDARTASIYDIYAARVSSAGAFYWTANGVPICTAADQQFVSGIATDGTGTVIIVWTDYRNYATNNYDIYAQAITYGSGTLWGTNGVAVCTNTAQQRNAVIVADATGGAFVAWIENRTPSINEIWGQHLGPGGASLWTADGIALSSGGLYKDYPVATSDGAGGFIVGWEDNRSGPGNYDFYAGRYNSSGSQLWTTNGVGLCTNPAGLFHYTLVSDGDGGAIGVIAEGRVASYDLFAQRADRYGYLGWTAPLITAAKDVPADQGGRVKLSFKAPYIEDDPYYAVSSYRIYRSVSPQALASRAAPARITSDPDEAALAPQDVLYHSTFAAADYYWEFLSSVTVDYLGNYSVLAATAYDSTGLGNPRTAFMVQARSGSRHWDSPPDSGYSVDNLAPLAPAPFTGQYAAGTTSLHWNPNTEADLAGYRLYRGTTAGFAADPAHLVAAQADTGYVDPAGGPRYYKLGAVDTHGNESPLVALLPSGALDVPGGAFPTELALARPSPNPARGEVTFAFSLPGAAHVTLALHDVAGRRVALLSDGTFEAGEHRVRAALADDAGRPLGSGLYWARLETPHGVRMQRLAVVR
jgi:hypothetical protein